jgi:hypothetical protein
MMTEEQVSLEQRFLWLDGIVSPSGLKAVEEGLRTVQPAHSRVCFVGFSYADLPSPKRFDILFI